MSNPSIEKTILPDHLKKDLDKFCTDLGEAVKENLSSIIVYGGLAKEEFDENSSDINLLLILKRLDIETLDKINPVLQQGKHQFLLEPFILAEEDISPSASLFPIKFLDIKENHITLWGKDCLNELAIPQEHIKRNCQRELRNLILRMNQFYILNYRFEEKLKFKLIKAFSSVIVNMNILFRLEKNVSFQLKAEIIQEGIKNHLITKQLADDLNDMKKGIRQFTNAELKQIYAQFLKVVRNLGSKAENLN